MSTASSQPTESSGVTAQPEPFGPLFDVDIEDQNPQMNEGPKPFVPKFARSRKGFVEMIFTQPFFVHVSNLYTNWVSSPGKYVYRAIIKPVLTFVFVSALWFWPIPAAISALAAFTTYCITIPNGYTFYDCMFDFHSAFMSTVSTIDDMVPYWHIRTRDVQMLRIVKMVYNSVLGLVTKLPLWILAICELPVSMCLTDDDREEAVRRGPRQSRYSRTVMKELRKQQDTHSAEKLHSISKKYYDLNQPYKVDDDATPEEILTADAPVMPKSFNQTAGAGPSQS